MIDKEDITEEYIRDIKHVELFRLVVKKMNWNRKDCILPTKVRSNTLEEYKSIAIELLKNS